MVTSSIMTPSTLAANPAANAGCGGGTGSNVDDMPSPPPPPPPFIAHSEHEVTFPTTIKVS